MKEFECLKKVWKYAKEYKTYFVIGYIVLLAELLFTQLLPLALERLIDASVYKLDIKLFLYCSVIYIFVFICQQSCALGQLQLWQRTNNKYIYSIRQKCFERVIYSKAYILSNHNTGDIIHTINADTVEFHHIIQRYAMRVVNAGIGTLVSVIIVANMKLEIAIIICVLVPSSVLFTNIVKKKLKKISTEKRQKQGELTSWIFEILKGVQTIKIYAAEKNVCNIFSRNNENLYLLGKKQNDMQILYGQIISLIYFISQIVFYIISAIYVVDGSINIAEYISIATYYNLISNNFQKILNENLAFQTRQVSIERVLELLDYEIEDNEKYRTLSILSNEVCVENLSFSYERKKPILSGISINVKGGQRIGVVGASGVGKTTLAYLLMKFYDPDSGCILIGGNNISDYSIFDLRNSIGIVNQENIVFDSSIKDNICFGRNVDDEIIWNLIDKVQLRSDIEKLPAGIHTMLGNTGVELSGGQKQRLSIARMLYRNPSIIILDEVTSSVDTKLESEIQQALSNLLENRTCFIISHKVSILKDTDEIYLLKDGEIIASGTYQYLSENCDEFKKLFELKEVAQ